MTKVTAYIRCSSHSTKASIRFRIVDGNVMDATHTSEFIVSPADFDNKTQTYLEKANIPLKTKLELDRKILERKELLIRVYESSEKSEKFSSAWFNQRVTDYLNNQLNQQNSVAEQSESKIKKVSEKKDKKEQYELFLNTVFADFIEKYKISEVRKKNYRVIMRTLLRYEIYATTGKRSKTINLKDVTSDTLTQIEYFFKNEHLIAKDVPQLYKKVSEKRQPKPRGDNTISDMMTKLRTFFIWCYKNDLIQNNPFKNFKIKGCVYGTPIYISMDELLQIYQTDLSFRPQLAIQRDIFVFHSLIGCRVSDLMKLTSKNVIGGTITYVPNKSKHKHVSTLVVPLNETSKEIIDRYKNGEKLLPFISEQKYNKAIKEIFKLAGITRKVVVINSLTLEEEIVPINTIASSHMCRRNLVGNLYQRLPDPAIIGSITGHSPTSRAFSRYRTIENEIKKSAIDQLNLKR